MLKLLVFYAHLILKVVNLLVEVLDHFLLTLLVEEVLLLQVGEAL